MPRTGSPPHSIVIGAGIGGLTTAALLTRAGHRVTVLEAHVYPGGSAGTFYHKRFRFDAGATLAGGFAPGGPHHRLAELLDIEWPIAPVDPAWVTHLPDGRSVTQWADRAAWRSEISCRFPGSERFWQRQEKLADLAWDVSSRPFPWPPESLAEGADLLRAFHPRLLPAAPYALQSIGDLLPADPALRTFVDAQLIIAAQTVAAEANALYGSAALDLPRRGVNHIQGGIGALADTLVDWLRANGAKVLYRQEVTALDVRDGAITAVHTKKGERFSGDYFVANLTPWALAELLGDDAPGSLRREVAGREATWGAFTLYLGLDSSLMPAAARVGHHQVVVDPDLPLGEGNSVFISLSDPDDPDRAPAGRRAATLSTHTAIAPWWQLRLAADPAAYEKRRAAYAERLIAGAERALPGLRQAITLCLPGTPVTFAFYTRRPGGMVGGFPQTSLFAARGPATGLANTWLVGDSVFPGQSTAGVTLSGFRVATAVRRAAA